NVQENTAHVINTRHDYRPVHFGAAFHINPPTATDNAGTNYALTMISTVTNVANHCGNTFDVTRTWIATDACGNSAQCSQTVNVLDNTAPVINCSNTNKTVQLGAAWDFDPPTATDNGGTNIVLTIVGTVTNVANHCGNTFEVRPEERRVGT